MEKPVEPKNKSKVRILKWGIIIFVLLFFVVGCYFIWNATLFGKRIEPSSSILLTQATIQVSSAEQSGATQTDASTISSKEKKSICGGSGQMKLIALGIDSNEQADAIRLINADFVNKKIIVLSIPRDLWVTVPDMAENNITEGRINATYGYGEYFNGKGHGIVSFSNAILANFGIMFDHYFVIHFDSFQKVIDMIGGVDITLDEPLDGTAQGLPYFSEGVHHLDGVTALKFIRVRFPDTDNDRIDRQSELIKLVYDKIKQPDNILKLPVIGTNMLSNQSVSTDLSLADLSKLACLVKSTRKEDIEFYSIPGTYYTPTHTPTGGYIDIPKPDIVQYIQKTIEGKN